MVFSNYFQMKTIVNTLAAAAEAEAEAQAQDESQGHEEQPGVMTAPQSPRAPRTVLLPQDMPMEERPHCKYLEIIKQFNRLFPKRLSTNTF